MSMTIRECAVDLAKNYYLDPSEVESDIEGIVYRIKDDTDLYDSETGLLTITGIDHVRSKYHDLMNPELSM